MFNMSILPTYPPPISPCNSNSSSKRLNVLTRLWRIVKTLWLMKWMFRSLFSSIFFNFHYLPFRQAIKLPILLYKPRFIKIKGKIQITGPVTFGMIQLGKFSANINPNNGISFENLGGTITFEGRCLIGNSAYLVVGPKGNLTIGNGFRNTTGIRIICYKSIVFGQYVSIGWNSILMDTNFHPLIDKRDNTCKKASGPIEIGSYNWLGTECLVMHSTKTPPRCIFGARCTITKRSEMESYCVTVPSSKCIVATNNVYRDIGGDLDFDKSIQ